MANTLDPQPPVLSSDERTWAVLAHLGALGGSIFGFGFVIPMVILLTKGNDLEYVKSHSREALNFQLTLLVAFLAVFVSYLVMVFLVPWWLPIVLLILAGFTLGGVALAFPIIAGVKSSRGQEYKYPVAIRFVH